MRTFAFPEVPDLRDGDLTLQLRETTPGNPAIAYVPDMRFSMLLDGFNHKVGGIQLRLGITDELLYHGGQIGYGVDEPFRGRRLAARSVRLLLPVAKAAGMDEIWITCDPDNIASRRSIEIAGGEYVETREIAEWSPMRIDGRTHSCRFRFPL